VGVGRSRAIRIAIVGAENMLARLPEALHGDGVEIVLVAPAGSYLLASDFVTQRVELSPLNPKEDWFGTVVRNGQLIADLDADFYLLGSDALALAIASSNLPRAVKLRLLPLRHERALGMVGSKVGFARAMHDSLTPGPSTKVATSSVELEVLLQSSSLPVVVKGDTGAGGAAVEIVRAPGFTAPEDWFPVVVQEFVPGIETGVEALFVNGCLAGWLYSRVIASVVPRGPSAARRFITPPALDFVESLESIGRFAGLHGMFNASLMWNPSTNTHALFELDVRPNTWFQFARTLGVDWSALMAETGETSPVAHPSVGSSGRVIRLYPHEIVGAIRYGNPGRLLLWCGIGRGTYRTRNHLDRAVNHYERRLIRLAYKERVARSLIAVERGLPAPIARELSRRGITSVLNRMMSRPNP